MLNDFRKWNKSILVNMFMSNDYTYAYYISDYDEIDEKNDFLFWACYYKNIDMARLLLSHLNINVNIQDTDGNTALDWACKNNNKKLINILKQHNAK